MTKVFPSITRYDASVKSLNKSVLAQQFKGGVPIYNPNGNIPSLVKYSGGYSVVYPIQIQKSKKALRCWLKEPGNVKDRFEKVNAYLADNPLSYFVEFGYSEKGILVDGNQFPVCYMDWIEGKTLTQFIDDEINYPAKIKIVAVKFLEMVKELHKKDISHGDLQDGNIIVCMNRANGSLDLKLVDYDRIYTPNQKGNNYKDKLQGVSDYQPPLHLKRTSNEKADYFSELVIYISLLAYTEDPTLWIKGQEKRLLFIAKDFENNNSSTFRKLKGMSKKIRNLSAQLEKFCHAHNYNDLLPLEKVVSSQSPSGEIADYFSDSAKVQSGKSYISETDWLLPLESVSNNKTSELNGYFSKGISNTTSRSNTTSQSNFSLFLKAVFIGFAGIFLLLALNTIISSGNEISVQATVVPITTVEKVFTAKPPVVPTVTVANSATISYFQSFENAPEWGWESDHSKWIAENGKLHADIDGLYYSTNYPNNIIGDYNNVTVDVDVLKISGSDNNEMGIMCNISEEGFYAFTIGSDQYFEVFKLDLATNEETRLSGDGNWLQSSLINTKTYNHLSATCSNGKLIFSVNDNEIAVLYDHSYRKGYVGLYISSLDDDWVSVEFDNFKVESP